MPSDLRQVKICENWEPNEAEKVDPVLYASNVPLGGKARPARRSPWVVDPVGMLVSKKWEMLGDIWRYNPSNNRITIGRNNQT
jgi:hypothetical protein